MSRKINFKNNFNSFEEDFKVDTGLRKSDNIEAYINYVNTRIADRNYQMNWHIMNELINIPKAIALDMKMNGH